MTLFSKSSDKIEVWAYKRAAYNPAAFGDVPEATPGQMAIGGTCPDCGGNLRQERSDRGRDYSSEPYDEYTVECVGNGDPTDEYDEGDGCGYGTGWFGGDRAVEQRVEQDAQAAHGHPPIDYEDAFDTLLVESRDGPRFDYSDGDSLIEIAQSRGEVPQLIEAYDHWLEDTVWPATSEMEEMNFEYLLPETEEDREQYLDENGITTGEWYESDSYKGSYDYMMDDFGPHQALDYMNKQIGPLREQLDGAV